MSNGKSPWWRAFDKVERKVGEPLENVVASPRYVDVVVKGMRVQRAIGGALGRVAGGAVTKVLHVAQIPTREEVRKLNRQLTTLTTEMRALTAAQQRQQRDATNKPKPKPKSAPKSSGEASDGD